jgi:dCTP deaminase
MRISQLTFTRLSSPAERPYGAERGSKYQNQTGPQASRIGDDPEFRAPEDVAAADERGRGDGDGSGTSPGPEEGSER